ncbi:uncharacterized protein lrrc53 [Odontesthes bonariensis]|uniref:uncharacterized protein lrrc53 n=1 Tax=Odontesthes bonariensis TaxID=219752 RepID=UPI003F585BE2
MISILLMLLLSVIRAQQVSPVPSCPASCVVCSEEAVICQRLTHIIDAPDSTQALFLTEGSISAVQPASLSDLTNITVIGLSHNHISELGKEAFRNLPFLHTLLLDHNLLTGQALQGGALTNLTQLEVLALGHNLISMIQAVWFKGSKALLSLKLEGNLLTSLDSGSFPLNDLRELETLDLSDNLIDNLERNSFHGLVSLKTLDLSRNRLSSAPAEAFSYLSWLTSLNLDLNTWNCTCELLELAAVLSTFIQQPDKTLYNGRKMVCVSADNPAVTTVLELTEANCVPSNQNITVQIETRGSITPQLYARDLAITAVICFIGGVGLTLLAVFIYYQVSRRKKLKESRRLEEEEQRNGTVANHISHLNVSERTRDFLLQANSSHPWNKEAMTSDSKTYSHGGHFKSRAEENGSYLQCPHCNTDRMMPNPMRRDNWMNGGIEVEGDQERRIRRMMMEEERRRTGIQHGNLSRDKIDLHGNTNSSFHPPREISTQRTETSLSYKTGKYMDNHRANVEAKVRGYETLHCKSCHRTYRPSDHDVRQGRIRSNPTDSALFDDFPSQHRLVDRKKNDHHKFDDTKRTELRRDSRNVTFDLGSPRISQGKKKMVEEAGTSRDKDKIMERTHKVQSSRLLKVKLNLNPLRKSKVLPRRNNEQGHTEKGSSKKSKEKSKEKRQSIKEGEGRGSIRKSSKRNKNTREKIKKSSETGGSAKEGEKEKEDKQKEEGGQKSKTSAKKKKTTSLSEQDSPEDTVGDQAENSHPESSRPEDNTTASAQSVSAAVSAQAQSMQSSQYQGAGLAPGGTQLSYQHPFSLISADKNRTSNFSLLGSAGPQPTGSSLSLQAGNRLLHPTSAGSTALLPGGPTNPTDPGITFSGPSMALRGATGSLGGKAAGEIMSSVPSLLAHSVHANTLQSSSIHTPHLNTSQTTGHPLNVANPAVNPTPSNPSESQLPSNGSPLVATLKADSVQSIQTGEGQLQLPTESQTLLTKESLSDQGQNEISAVTPQAGKPMTTVESISNNNSQTETEHVPGGSTVNMPAEDVTLTEGLAVGGLGEGKQVAGASVSGVSAPSMSTPSGSSPGAAPAAAPLLQQEYLSEEGGSSPRRKLRLVLPEKTSSRPPTSLERKIR